MATPLVQQSTESLERAAKRAANAAMILRIDPASADALRSLAAALHRIHGGMIPAELLPYIKRAKSAHASRRNAGKQPAKRLGGAVRRQ